MATTVFFNVFIVKTVGKGHGLMLRLLFLIGVWHIKQKRRAWLRWLYNLLGGMPERMTYARVVIVLHLYLLEQCLNPVLRTSIKSCNFVIFYKFLIHLGVHHTLCMRMHKWCIVAKDAWGYEYDPSNLRLCDTGGQSIGSAKERQRDKDKGILTTHITAQYTVT